MYTRGDLLSLHWSHGGPQKSVQQVCVVLQESYKDFKESFWRQSLLIRHWNCCRTTLTSCLPLCLINIKYGLSCWHTQKHGILFWCDNLLQHCQTVSIVTWRGQMTGKFPSAANSRLTPNGNKSQPIKYCPAQTLQTHLPIARSCLRILKVSVIISITNNPP